MSQYESNLTKKKCRQYLLRLSILVLILCTPFALAFAYIVRAGENMTYPEIADFIIQNDGIMSSSISENHQALKLELYKRHKPDFITLGSSKFMTVRKEIFNSSMINCSLAMNSLENGIEVLEKLLAIHKPKTILLSLDSWWFYKGYSFSRSIFRPRGDEIIHLKFTEPLMWLYEGKLSWAKFKDVLLYADRTNPFTTHPALGTIALTLSSGYRRDGSTIPNLKIINTPPKSDAMYKYLKNLVINGISPLIHLKGEPDPDRIAQLKQISQICKNNDVELVMFYFPLAPFAQKIKDEDPEEAAFVKKLREALHNFDQQELHDFYDDWTEIAHDCEYLDPLHPGETAILRVILKALERKSGSLIAPYLNKKLIEELVEKYSGKLIIPFQAGEYKNFKETDFLNLGCPK